MSLRKRFERKERAIPYLPHETFISFPKGLLYNSCQYLHHMTNRENTVIGCYDDTLTSVYAN